MAEKTEEKAEAAVVAPVIDVKFKDLRVAVVALNESKLLKSSIKLVGITKNQILADFMAGIEGIPDDPKTGKFPGPKDALDFYNQVLDLQEKAKAGAVPPAAEKVKADKSEKTKKTEKEKAVKEKKEKAESGETKGSFIKDLISAGKMTKAEVVEATQGKFPQSSKASTMSMISHGMNPKYEKTFGKVVIKDGKGILSFGK